MVLVADHGRMSGTPEANLNCRRQASSLIWAQRFQVEDFECKGDIPTVDQPLGPWMRHNQVNTAHGGPRLELAGSEV